MKAALLIVSIFCMLLDVCILAFSVTRKDRMRSLYFTVMTAAVGLYLLGYMLQVYCNSLEASMIAIKVQNLGVPLMGPLFLLFVLSVGQYKVLKQWMLYVCGGYGFAMFIAVLFNEYHLLYYPSATLMPISDMYYVVLRYGPLYYVQQAVSNLCIFLAYLALINRLIKWSATARKRMVFMFVGSLMPVVSNLLFVTHRIPQYLDIVPFSMLLAMACVAVAIWRYQLYDITSEASEAAIRSMDDAMVVLDLEWYYQYANDAAVRLFPELGSFRGVEPIGAVKGWPKGLIWRNGPGSVNFELGEGDAQRFFTATVSAVGSGATAIGWCVVIRDITENTQLLDQMKKLAITDGLTGIYNRRYFLESVTRELEIARRLRITSALVIFDLDRFKNVNDTYGHQMGDVVLCTVVDTVQSQLRKYDIFARYGGEEFALYIINIDDVNAEAFTQRLCEAVADIRIPHEGEFITITASFGLVPVHWEDDLDDAISIADQAMYSAKQGGRNRVVVGQRRDEQLEATATPRRGES